MGKKSKIYNIILRYKKCGEFDIGSIISALKPSKFAYKSAIKKIIASKKFQIFLSEKNILAKLREILENGFYPSKPTSYRKTDQYYTLLCKKLNKTNNLRNRLIIYKNWSEIRKKYSIASFNTAESPIYKEPEDFPLMTSRNCQPCSASLTVASDSPLSPGDLNPVSQSEKDDPCLEPSIYHRFNSTNSPIYETPAADFEFSTPHFGEQSPAFGASLSSSPLSPNNYNHPEPQFIKKYRR